MADNLQFNSEAAARLSHVETKIYSGAFCLQQNAQRAALRAAGQGTSGNRARSVLKHLVTYFQFHYKRVNGSCACHITKMPNKNFSVFNLLYE